ncbi:hypothetical protein GW17_00052805, partial [Ensete ventricosum]
VGRLFGVPLLHVVDDVFDDADERGGADSQPHQQYHLVLLVLLGWCSIRPIEQHLWKATYPIIR